jgi:hypothetical protein
MSKHEMMGEGGIIEVLIYPAGAMAPPVQERSTEKH